MPVILLGKYYRLMGVYVKKTSSRYRMAGISPSAMTGNKCYTVKMQATGIQFMPDWNKYEGLIPDRCACEFTSQNIIRANKRAVWGSGVMATCATNWH